MQPKFGLPKAIVTHVKRYFKVFPIDRRKRREQFWVRARGERMDPNVKYFDCAGSKSGHISPQRLRGGGRRATACAEGLRGGP